MKTRSPEYELNVDYEWKPEYDELLDAFFKKHFGNLGSLARLFPTMRDEYKWKDRTVVVDSRIPAKNNIEYHGLERYALQYHVTGLYEYSYHHWLLAAKLRNEDLVTNNFTDENHKIRIQYCIKQALYNKALYEWQSVSGKGIMPDPKDFMLKVSDIEKEFSQAEKQLEEASKIPDPNSNQKEI